MVLLHNTIKHCFSLLSSKSKRMKTASNNWLTHKNRIHHSLPTLDHRLCLVCGDHFTKASLPSHYKAFVSVITR